MHPFCTIAGIASILAILLDAFETIVLPRRVQRTFRLTSWFYRNTWIPWVKVARHIRANSWRERFLGYFGPFALIQFGLGEHVRLGNEPIPFGILLYHSGETFFPLGYGEITPTSPLART